MKKAFTLIELFIVMTISMIIIGFGVPQMANMLFENQLEVTSQEIVHVLRRAQTLSTTQVKDSAWGVYFDTVNQQYKFFTGTTYATRTEEAVFNLPGSVTFGTIDLGGGSEVDFAQTIGNTSNVGTVILNSNNIGSRTITINDKGNVTSN